MKEVTKVSDIRKRNCIRELLYDEMLTGRLIKKEKIGKKVFRYELEVRTSSTLYNYRKTLQMGSLRQWLPQQIVDDVCAAFPKRAVWISRNVSISPDRVRVMVSSAREDAEERLAEAVLKAVKNELCNLELSFESEDDPNYCFVLNVFDPKKKVSSEN